MDTLDWVVVAGYFLGLLALAWWVIRQSKDTADDYFLAGRHLGWFIVGASIFASNIGSEHLVGLASTGATNGVIFAHYELHAWCLLVLAWVLVPFYMRSMVYTMPEFLERRFSPTARWVLSLISLVAYVLTKIAVGIFAGGYPTGINNVESSLGGQLMGMMAFLPLAFLPGYVASWILKRVNLLRVPAEVELEGLDMAEFQQDFFPEFERVPEIVIEPDGREVDGAPVLLEAYWQTTNGRPTAPVPVGGEERS